MPLLTGSTLVDWISTLAPAPPNLPWPPLRSGPYINEMPDKLITLTMLPGLGFAAEGALDQPSFQVRCRGDQNDQSSAENIAFQIDDAIFNAQYPVSSVDFSNDYDPPLNIVLVTRLSGAPAPLGPPEEPSFRYEYVCTYRCVIGV
jgi:hypothetical protein